MDLLFGMQLVFHSVMDHKMSQLPAMSQLTWSTECAEVRYDIWKPEKPRFSQPLFEKSLIQLIECLDLDQINDFYIDMALLAVKVHLPESASILFVRCP